MGSSGKAAPRRGECWGTGWRTLRDPAKPRPTDVLADVRAQTYLPEYRPSA
jgi:hypothetical protein